MNAPMNISFKDWQLGIYIRKFFRNVVRKPRSLLVAVAVAVIVVEIILATTYIFGDATNKEIVVDQKPALSVEITTPQPITAPIRISANGDIMAWQEASIGSEANGLRLITVTANVGDVVRRGDVLAVFDSNTVTTELLQSRAVVAELEALFAEAEDGARRAKQLQSTGAMSTQQILQYVIAERTAQARLNAAKAAQRIQQLRLVQTQVLAPDDGVISARAATVGAVLPSGQELFRLIRRGRLEWRAEVAASDLAKLKPGQITQITPVGGNTITGKLRVVAPTIDTQTRNGMVFVDLPRDDSVTAGMFARGEFEVGSGPMLTLPQAAVLLRDGFSYVMQVGSDSKVTQTKVTVGRRVGDRVEIIQGIGASARVVASGGGFLGEGDLVRVVENTSTLDVDKTVSGSPIADAKVKAGTP